MHCSAMKKINVITLGCSKNTVDSEHLMAQLEAAGYTVAADSDRTDAKVVVINTCGFIGDAKQESIDMILRAAAAKQAGRIERLFVVGCLSERYADELRAELPEVDEFFGVKDWAGIARALGAEHRAELETERRLTTPAHYAYLKIGEGCNWKCGYCAIPLIRGPHVSVPMEVLEEEGALSLCWQPQGAPVQTVDLPLSELLAYAREQAARREEVPVDHVNGQLLKLVLEEHRLESEYGWDTFEVDRILVYQGEQLIQTLLPEDWLGSAEFGLFVCDGDGLGSLGQPLTLDLNWDGVQDFGLMCMEGGARNVPYLYFVWNGEGFSPVAVLCAPAEVDPESRQIVERVCEGNGVDTVNWYEFGGGNQLELVRSETNTVPDGIG